MFNIMKKIYVAHDQENHDYMRERIILLHPQFVDTIYSRFDGMEEDPRQKGMLFTYHNLDDLIAEEFDGEVSSFHQMLSTEEDLLIVVDEVDYVRLYTQMQMELQKTFGVADENLDRMANAQRLKDFTAGDSVMREFCLPQGEELSAFETIRNEEKSKYVPTGKVYGNILELPFEVAYVLYKWGNINKQQVNVKVGVMARGMLLGQIHNLMENLKLGIGASAIVLQEFLDDDTIVDVDDIMVAINGNKLLKSLLCHSRIEEGGEGMVEVDLQKTKTLNEVRRLCEIAIKHDLDHDAQPEVDQAELDLFFKLYEEKDIEVLEELKFNSLSTGMVVSKMDKFNSLLIMSE